ncbi:MAG: hypothetical protein AAF493_14720, partial [Pseudomonadota bacterium]
RLEAAIAKYQVDMQKVEKDEFKSWEKGIEDAGQALNEELSRNRKAYETNEAKSATGLLKISVPKANELSRIRLMMDGQLQDWPQGAQSRVIAGLPVGNRVVSLFATLKDGEPFSVEEVVSIKSNVTEDLAFAVPEHM